MSQILIIEDEDIIRQSLAKLLSRHGKQVSESESIEQALEKHRPDQFDLIITDLRLPGLPGTEIIQHAGTTPVLVMTSYASVKSAVESMKMGAVDYIAKPFDHDEMIMLVDRILEQRQLQIQHAALKSELQRNYPVGGMIGNSPGMQQVFAHIQKVAPTDTTVLILGESGTGKELAARAVHEMSQRANSAIITVNCAAIPGGLIESELFGHEKGAFTGANETRTGLIEAADGGTLFLDEIGELPLDVQARLLRVLQEGEIRRVGSNLSRKVNVRLIAATHRDLEKLVAEQQFRDDLYYRLRVMEIRLPPLREREADIEALAEAMLAKNCQRLNRPPMRFNPAAMRQIKSYHWPGNVRELENVIQRAVILADTNVISAGLLAIQSPTASSNDAGKLADKVSLDDYFVQFVKDNQDNMNETELAKKLGISRKTLWERRQKLGLSRSKSS